MYLNSDLFGINCATGMSALMRKELLDNKGGFEAFGCYLAEDFFFAQAVQVGQSSFIATYHQKALAIKKNNVCKP